MSASARPLSYWLVKQEPTAYPFSQLLKDRTTLWTGVRNFQARNNLRAMKRGDRVFYYHSVEEKQIVGWCEVSREAFPDPTAEEGDWSCVELKALAAAPTPLGLAEMKADVALTELPLIRQSRLSVMPIRAAEAKILVKKLGLR